MLFLTSSRQCQYPKTTKDVEKRSIILFLNAFYIENSQSYSVIRLTDFIADWWYIFSAPSRRTVYCDEHVCLSVCLHVHLSPNYLCMLPMAVAALRYVLYFWFYVCTCGGSRSSCWGGRGGLGTVHPVGVHGSDPRWGSGGEIPHSYGINTFCVMSKALSWIPKYKN